MQRDIKQQTTIKPLVDWLADNCTFSKHQFTMQAQYFNDTLRECRYVVTVDNKLRRSSDYHFLINEFSETELSKKLTHYTKHRHQAIIARSLNQSGQNILHYLFSANYAAIKGNEKVLCGYKTQGMARYTFSFINSQRTRIELEPIAPRSLYSLTMQHVVFEEFKSNVAIKKDVQHIIHHQITNSWDIIQKSMDSKKKNKLIEKLLIAIDADGKTPAHVLFACNQHPNLETAFTILTNALGHAQSKNKNILMTSQDNLGNNIFHYIALNKINIDLDLLVCTLLNGNKNGRDYVRAALLQRNNDGNTPLFFLLKSNQHDNYQKLSIFLQHNDSKLASTLKNRDGESLALDNINDSLIDIAADYSESDKEEYSEQHIEMDNHISSPLEAACQSGHLKMIQSALYAMQQEGHDWELLNIEIKQKIFLLACQHCAINTIEFLCEKTKPVELDRIVNEYQYDINQALKLNHTKITKSEFMKTIDHYTAFQQLFAYFKNKKSSESRLYDFAQVIYNIENGMNPFSNTRDFFKNNYMLFSGTERYHELRNKLCNHPMIITGKGKALVQDFKDFLHHHPHDQTANRIMTALNALENSMPTYQY